MRALIQRRAYLLHEYKHRNVGSDMDSSSNSSTADHGKCYLFFGCRRSDKDFYYKHEWDMHCSQGELTSKLYLYMIPF